MRVALLSTMGLCASTLTLSTIVDSYIGTESVIAKAGMLANIGPNGSKCAGANAGIVIASPSRENPDYLYTWVRDASLVFKEIIDEYTLGHDTSLRGLIDDFVSVETDIQQVSNPSGTVSTGGLGEPKFMINGTAFTEPWGRPQRDGPPLRATALIAYANWLVANGNKTHVSNTLWPTIQLDLDYVISNWNQSTFDLWEEVSSSSFWTASVQHRALREGAALATTIDKTSLANSYTTQADNLLCFMQSFWNPSRSYMTSNTGGGRSGVDANTALASIHTFDAAAGCDSITFQPCSDKALSSLKVYVDSFRSTYSINKGIPFNQPVATGRYFEDVYIGGNPWYITTAAVAQQLYDALIVWKAEGSLSITSISLPFFRQFSPVTTGTYASSSPTFITLTSAIKTYADGFIAIMAKYTPKDGALAEQFDRNNGHPVSAADLTWSYAAALTAFAARNGTVPASWGAKGLVVPSVCHSYSGPTVPVTFEVVAYTVWRENVYLTGSVEALANWSPDKALSLSSSSYPKWSVTVNVPASANIEYKYIRKHGNGTVIWESEPNNRITTPASGSTTTNDTWR